MKIDRRVLTDNNDWLILMTQTLNSWWCSQPRADSDHCKPTGWQPSSSLSSNTVSDDITCFHEPGKFSNATWLILKSLASEIVRGKIFQEDFISPLYSLPEYYKTSLSFFLGLDSSDQDSPLPKFLSVPNCNNNQQSVMRVTSWWQ